MADGGPRGRRSSAPLDGAPLGGASRERTSREGTSRARASGATGASGAARLQVEIVTSGGMRVPGLAMWLQAVAPARARGDVTVAIAPDARVRALNRRFREQDAATDVLSFPAGERGRLGDVVIAGGVARRQARDAGHSLQTELRILALHGLLHLLGYDHERDDGRMARVEFRLRRKGGLREGLIERGAGHTAAAPAR